jgi:hypothetical protein
MQTLSFGLATVSSLALGVSVRVCARAFRATPWVLLLLAAGCAGSGSKWGFVKNQDQVRTPPERPTTAQLVEYLNQNARQLQSVECMDVDLDCKVGHQPFGLQAKMACQKNRNFRLIATAVGNPQADMGSNEQEFWFWIAKNDPPYLYYCSYADLARPGMSLPFPFQPEWIMEAFGMAECDPAGNYTVNMGRGTYELVQQSVSPQGQPVQKVTVFAAGRNAKFPVRAHLLLDAKGKEICSAQITDAQSIGGVIVPTKVVLSWPEQRMELKMKLNGPAVNRLDQTSASRLFTRPALQGVQTFDMARPPESAVTQVRPAGGRLRQ